MTSPYVSVPQSQPQPASPVPSPASNRVWPIVRALLAVTVCLGGIPLALFAAFWASIEWSGCFMSCSEPNRAGGALAALLAVALLTAGPLLTAALYRSRTWVLIAAGTTMVGTVLMIGVLGTSA